MLLRLRRFLSEAPLFFFAVVIGVALTFRVAIGWAKSSPADDPAKDPTIAGAAAGGKTRQTASEAPATKTATPVVTAEPRPAATATVPSTPRKKPRPRR